MYFFFFFSSRRRHTRCSRDWSSDVCSSDLPCRRKGRACDPKTRAKAETQTAFQQSAGETRRRLPGVFVPVFLGFGGKGRGEAQSASHYRVHAPRLRAIQHSGPGSARNASEGKGGLRASRL